MGACGLWAHAVSWMPTSSLILHQQESVYRELALTHRVSQTLPQCSTAGYHH